MKIYAFITIVMALAAWPNCSYGHDHWKDGTPVPAWVKKACCGASDKHQYDDEDVHELKSGLKVNGFPGTDIEGYPGGIIPWSQVTPSPDGKTWLFFTTFSDGRLLMLHCVFHGYGGA